MEKISESSQKINQLSQASISFATNEIFDLVIDIATSKISENGIAGLFRKKARRRQQKATA